MCCRRRMERISRIERKTNEEVVNNIVEEKRSMPEMIKRRQ